MSLAIKKHLPVKSSSSTAQVDIDRDSVTDGIALLSDFVRFPGVMLFVKKRTLCAVPCRSGVQVQETRSIGIL
jgi:hypothetical protein